jgi:hypothetical protein
MQLIGFGVEQAIELMKRRASFWRLEDFITTNYGLLVSDGRGEIAN